MIQCPCPKSHSQTIWAQCAHQAGHSRGFRDGLPGAEGEGQTSLWAGINFFCKYMSHTGKIPKGWLLRHLEQLGWNKIGGCLTCTFLSQTSNCSFPKEKMKLGFFFFHCFPEPYNYLNSIPEFNLEPEERMNCYNLGFWYQDYVSFEIRVRSLPCGAGGCGAALIDPRDHRWEPGWHLDVVTHLKWLSYASAACLSSDVLPSVGINPNVAFHCLFQDAPVIFK